VIKLITKRFSKKEVNTMKKTALALSFAAAFVSATSVAQEAPPYENWVGGFGQYQKIDSKKPAPLGGFDHGKAYGVELGFRFDDTWAARFELSRIDVDNHSWVNSAVADDGTNLGADLMYFLQNDAAYVFGGLREQALTDTYRSASLGIGKHWVADENWRVITEAATYYDFGQGYNDWSLKLGLAYIFGQKTSAPTARPDTDGDGVYDAVDRCPATPSGTRVDATGCSLDADNDGVVNSIDECPDTPSGTSVNARGCPVQASDADGDGVMDTMDECADTPTTDRVDAKGCSVIEDVEVFAELDILFDNNSSQINNRSSELITEFVEFMQRYPNTTAIIEGHTSAVGNSAYNQVLSQRRADNVRQMLINDYGIDASRLQAVGFGESRLKFTENNAESHRLNRRIEARVTATVEEAAQR
jgi:OOP family OmpA-OmpF porin